MERYRGRFAPSPTGPLHFGSLVAAVGSFLAARAHGGVWLVRIDDLDPPRIVAGAADDILRTLEACGMEWDEPILYQGTRGAAYGAAVQRLRERGIVYPCTCSRREIADSALPGREGYVYPGTCRSRPREGRSALALRIDTRGAVISFDDGLQGSITQDLERDCGDFVLQRAHGVHAYQLAAAVDDAEQGITHVVRGADLLASTARQIYVQQQLGLPTPSYAHLPVAVDVSGEKLSKQTCAPPIDRGQPLPALIAALAFLGHPPPHELRAGDRSALWKWAIASWRLAKVPRRSSAPAP